MLLESLTLRHCIHHCCLASDQALNSTVTDIVAQEQQDWTMHWTRLLCEKGRTGLRITVLQTAAMLICTMLTSMFMIMHAEPQECTSAHMPDVTKASQVGYNHTCCRLQWLLHITPSHIRPQMACCTNVRCINLCHTRCTTPTQTE